MTTVTPVRTPEDVPLSRWVHCKYCYASVLPVRNVLENLVTCPRCGSGLAPLDAVAEAGSFNAWWEKIEREFAALS
jgi:hypothetical protein